MVKKGMEGFLYPIEMMLAQEQEGAWSMETEREMTERKRTEMSEQKLVQLVHNREWKEVVSLWKECPDFLGRPLTATNETTLHMAIMAGNEDAVTMLLEVLKNANKRIDVWDILTIENDNGVTPIHLAAMLDMDRACMDMAKLCPDLVTKVSNKDGETLLFEAVREGKKDLFFALELLVQNAWPNPPPEKMKRDVTHCRRDKDGNSILHIAIYGEYFDLASEIVHLYPGLVDYVNMRGETPLHSLANKPSSFKSGTSFNLFDQVIYSCITIERLQTNFDKYKCDEQIVYASDHPKLPETCNAILQIFNFIKPIFRKVSIIPKWSEKEQDKNDEENSSGGQQESSVEEKFPKIYEVGFALFKKVMKILLVILGIGLRTHTLRKMKRKHIDAFLLMKELVECSVSWGYKNKEGMNPHISRSSSSNVTPVLVAAKNGITEMVEKIINIFPMAMLDVDQDGKNIMLLAVEYQQLHMYEFMKERKIINDSVFRKVDKNGDSALHLAAKLSQHKLPWDLGGAALRMHWDAKWYKYVMNSRAPEFFATWNSDGKTAQQIFSEAHAQLLDDAGKWMQKTSQSMSVVATLIASVAFIAATTVPGGTKQDSGLPIFSDEFPFKVFTASAFIAFCSSVASLIVFVRLITSPQRAEDFDKSLPWKLLIGLTSLVTAIAAMLVAFCAGNLLAMEKKSQNIALVIYAISCFLVFSLAHMEFPLYVYLFKATLTNLPTKIFFDQTT